MHSPSDSVKNLDIADEQDIEARFQVSSEPGRQLVFSIRRATSATTVTSVAGRYGRRTMKADTNGQSSGRICHLVFPGTAAHTPSGSETEGGDEH